MRLHNRVLAARRILALLVLAIFLFAVGALHRYTFASPGPGDQSGTLDIGGRTRTYFVHVPSHYDGHKPLPLVFVLHGATQSPESAERMSGMSAKADNDNFLAVYPSGTGRLSRVPTWNSGACCSYAMEHNVDDVAFLRALIAKLKNEYSVDTKRIYFTGISNGGMMSYRAACDMSDEVAAIAPVEGAQDLACHPSNPVSVLVFHGTADHLVPFNGGSTPYQMGSKRSDTSVADTVAFWVKQDGCSPTPKRDEAKVVHTDVYSDCKDGSAVSLYAIQGGHHIWPGIADQSQRCSRHRFDLDFFRATPKTLIDRFI